MTWTWRPLGMTRAVWHAFQSWRREPGQEPRYDAACGGVGGDVEVDPDGRAMCLACRRLLVEEGKGAS